MAFLFSILGLATVIFLFWRFWYFLRNPRRDILDGDGFLAPADGYVIYVKRVAEGEIPMALKNKKSISLDEYGTYESFKKASGYLIGIFMTAFSVHHNRIPLSGKAVYKYRRKSNNNLSTARLMTNILLSKKPYEEQCNHVVENERVTLGITTPVGDYALTQIADKWISNIVNDIEIGDQMTRGALFGMIRFGSQVDVFIPDQLGYKPVKNPGDYVYAGKSILAEYLPDK